MRQDKFRRFRTLHQQQAPLVLVNIWDAGSAIIVQENGAAALATSSASLAWANGYADGCNLPLDILMSSISNILRVSNVPLSIDIETGYSDDPDEVAKLVKNLVDLGVSGINLEDGEATPELLIEKILAIKSLCEDESVFINARTDVYLRELISPENRLNECISRLQRYATSGADGAFVPGVNAQSDISEISDSINVPLNIMLQSSVDNFDQLFDLGIARISFGPDTFIKAYSKLSEISRKPQKNKSELLLSYETLNNLFVNPK